MYVFVTAAELTGKDKQLALGQVEEDITLETLKHRTMERIDPLLPEQDRDDSRHFWYNDRLIPLERTYLRDLAQTVNVTLELRPDTYQVELPRHSPERYAINPEMPVASAIDSLMGFAGAWQCYQLLPRGGEPLADETTLFQQGMLPYHARLSQQDTELMVRRRPQVTTWIAGVLAVSVVAGVLFGWLLKHLVA